MLNLGLVDSNILVYIADATDKNRHKKAKLFLDTISEEPGRFVISVQNLREFSSVMINKKKIKPKELEEYLSLFENSFEWVLIDSIDDVREASSLSLTKKTSFWDSLLVATMERCDVSLIYTENIKDFKKFKGIKAVNPLK